MEQPISQQPVKAAPRDIFLHLLNLAAFYISAVSYITLLITYINVILPDPLHYRFGNQDSIFWATSLLLVAFPTHLATAYILERDFKQTRAKRDLRVRRWLLYGTLFVAAVTMLGDTSVLIYNFLRGELTLRFFLKVMVVLLVAAAVFGYYYWELKRREFAKGWLNLRMLAIASGSLVIASIIGGFFIVGTPGMQRARRLDEQRVSDLSGLQSTVIDYWVRKEQLPDGLDTLYEPVLGYNFPRDPDTGRPYEYHKTGDLSFEICADFQSERTGQDEYGYAPKYYPEARPHAYAPGEQIGPAYWNHGMGRACFLRTIDPKLYKPITEAEKPPTPR